MYLKKALSFYKTKSKIVVASPITKRQVSQMEKQKTSTWINLESKKDLSEKIPYNVESQSFDVDFYVREQLQSQNIQD